MENVSLRQIINSKMQSTGATQGTMYDANGQSFGDVWSMIFASMGQNNTAGTDTLQNIGLGTTGQNADVLSMFGNDEQTKDDTQTQMLQQLAAMIMQMPTAQSASLLAQLEGTVSQYQSMQGINLSQNQLEQLYSVYNQIGKMPTKAENDALQQTFNNLVVEVVSQNNQTAQGQNAQISQSALMLNAEFKNAIVQAQQLLKNSDEQTAQQAALSVDQLQSQATQTNRSDLQATPLDTQHLADQLKENLQTATPTLKDFTVKLKPEGLGEITVKLTQTPKGIAMNIVASSDSVAKMINGELNSLQTALKPLNATVQTVVAQTSESGQFNFAGNQFSQNGQRQFFANQQQSNTYSTANQAEENYQVANVLAQPKMAANGLDTYI